MRPLTSVVARVRLSHSARLLGDYDLRVFSNDYSVDPSVTARVVDGRIGLEVMTMGADGRLMQP